MGLKNTDPFKKRVAKAAKLACNQVGRMLVAELRQVCSVRVQRRGSWIIRSEPGEPPRKEFGTLVKSFKYRRLSKGEQVSVAIVFTDYEIAAYLEYGTRHIEPRPFWHSTIRKAGNLRKVWKYWFKYFLEKENLEGEMNWPSGDTYETGVTDGARMFDPFEAEPADD